jgi:DNA-binding MarR family transcriptional regulator
MASRNRSTKRQQVIAATRAAGRELSVHGSLFYALVAERLGLTMTDLRAWDLLLLHGPVTHGKFAEMIGLTGGAVTNLVDRLERVGAVTRESDPLDRRKVIVRAISSMREGHLKHVFASLEDGAGAILNQFSDEQLEASSRLMLGIAQVLHQEVVKLRASEPLDIPAHPATANKRRGAVVGIG